METWRKVWREGVAPELTDAGLGALRAGLAADDPALLRGVTTSPPPLMRELDQPVEGACAVSYPFWRGDGLQTVGEVESAFALVVDRCEKSLGVENAIRFLTNWWDEEPPEATRPALLAEVEREIDRRRALAA